MKKKQEINQNSPSDNSTHIPTEIEIAFQKAEKKKKMQFASQRVKDPDQPNDIVGIISESTNILNQKKVPDCKLSSKKKDHICIPQKGILSKKQPDIIMGESQVNHALPSKKDKGQSTRLSLKPVAMKSLSLDSPLVSEKLKESAQHEEIDKNSKTQVFDPSNLQNINESDIIIGFDFGTSSSKIVIRDKATRVAYAVPFTSHNALDNRYILPTKIYVTDSGVFHLSGNGYLCSELKIDIMENPAKEVFRSSTYDLVITALELATAYTALMIRKARTWFLERTKLVYKKSQIFWHLNMGIPSKNYDDLQTRKTFKTLAMAAWRLSQEQMNISTNTLKDCLKEAEQILEKNVCDMDQSMWLHPDYVNTHPEVIMEVVGYAHSPLRKSGLHMLVDVGGSTVDTATFIIHNKEGEDIYPLLETNVDKHGTVMLHKHRMKFLKDKLENALQQISLIDPIEPLHEPEHYDIKADINQDIDAEFLHECSKKIGEILRKTKKCRDPYSFVWKNKLDVFICGGGGRLAIYRKKIEALGKRLSQQTDFQGFDIKRIPVPSELVAPDLSHKDYDRLAVAYGLSFSSDEIGIIIPRNEIEDINPDNRFKDIESRYIDKDIC